MWQGHLHHLCLYNLAICEVWQDYGYADTVYDKTLIEIGKHEDTGPPWWVGWEPLHSSHRAALKFKDPNYYHQRRTGWVEPAVYDYAWPDPARPGQLLKERQHA